MKHLRHIHLRLASIGLLGALFLAACQPLTPTPAPAEVTDTATPEAATTAASALPTDAPATEPVVTAAAPVNLSLPELGLDIAVAPMGWEIVEVDGQRTTQWVVPENAAGWAINSAGAGGMGNMVIAGHQTRGDAVFAALALGEVEPGQKIVVTDAAGAKFTYQVVEVSEPLPLLGATAAERAQAEAFVAPSTDARLTLVTGWPADTTTHRIFVVAELTSATQ